MQSFERNDAGDATHIYVELRSRTLRPSFFKQKGPLSNTSTEAAYLRLVGRSLASLLSTNTSTSETKGHGWMESYLLIQ